MKPLKSVCFGWYANPENHDYSKKQDKQIVAGVEHTFAWGGGHGARAKYSADGVFLIIDVTAYYPSLQKKYRKWKTLSRMIAMYLLYLTDW